MEERFDGGSTGSESTVHRAGTLFSFYRKSPGPAVGERSQVRDAPEGKHDLTGRV